MNQATNRKYALSPNQRGPPAHLPVTCQDTLLRKGLSYLPRGCHPGTRGPLGREAGGGCRSRDGSLAAGCLYFGGVDVCLGLLDPGKDLFEECLVLGLALLQPLIHGLHVLA